MEDEVTMHSKNVGDKAEAAIAAIEANIVEKGGHGICPNIPSDAVADVDISNIKLSEPPTYQLGEKVSY